MECVDRGKLIGCICHRGINVTVIQLRHLSCTAFERLVNLQIWENLRLGSIDDEFKELRPDFIVRHELSMNIIICDTAGSCRTDKKMFASARPGVSRLLRYLNSRHDVIMHYIVITNSGNLKQPGRDTILIETTDTTYYYYYYCMILALIRRRRLASHRLLCFVSFVCLFLVCYEILHW